MLATFVAIALAGSAAAQSCSAGTLPVNQTAEWVACPVEDEPTLECATIQVPVDYTNANSEVLVLPIVRIPANESASIGKSIIFNPGGPGASGIGQLVGGGSSLQVLAGGEYHIVSFDPRGVGLTEPYQCPTADPVTGYTLPLNDPVGLNATYVYNENQGELCNQTEYREAGVLVGTAFVARDIDAIAQSLQEDGMIRYWGFSYGTLLGATLAAMFPEKMDRIILDGNINPTDYYHGLNAESVDDVDAAVTHFFDNCVEAGPNYCALADGSSTSPELEAQFNDFIAGLKNESYHVLDYEYSEPAGYQAVTSFFYSMLKSPTSWSDVSTILAYYYTNTISGTSSSSLKRRQDFDPTVADTVEVPQALSAITCGDWDDINGSLQDFQDWLKLYQDRSKFGGDQLISILYSCATWKWNAKEKYTGKFTDIETKTPVFFINGPYDPVTPLVSAQNSSSGFVGSALLEHKGAGHCSTAQPSVCVTRKIASYFKTGEIPDVSEICEPDVQAFYPYDPTANITGPDTNGTESEESQRFRAATYDLVNLLKKRDTFEYPAAFNGVKRDVYAALKNRRQATSTTASSATGSCTPITAVAETTSTPMNGSGESSSSSGDQNAASSYAVSVSVIIGASVALGMMLVL